MCVFVNYYNPFHCLTACYLYIVSTFIYSTGEFVNTKLHFSDFTYNFYLPALDSL